nr:MHYT domain-containing protein [uncultured Cohaesibacter sp.]
MDLFGFTGRNVTIGALERMITYSYNLPLVIASIVVSVLAAFTGFAVTNGISELSINKRKLSIGMAAVVFGGGIWSMHFVAILALELPVSTSYDAPWTLSSILIAILMTGTALLIMHFARRSLLNTIIAGCFLGYGIVTMHYVGLLGIQGCIPVFDYLGQTVIIIIGPATGFLAVWLAYKQRTRRNIILGTFIFGVSVSLIHYAGIYWTGFAVLPVNEPISMAIDHGSLALLVIFATFIICGAFLFTATTFLVPAHDHPVTTPEASSPSAAQIAEAAIEQAKVDDAPSQPPVATRKDPVRIPIERKNRQIEFILPEEVAAFQAEGRYTVLHTGSGKHFCSWSISEAREQLPDHFIQTHRSFIVNIRQVKGFTRSKDNGKCIFEGITSLSSAPVSRTRINEVKAALGI